METEFFALARRMLSGSQFSARTPSSMALESQVVPEGRGI
jgi:hypothetical protein